MISVADAVTRLQDQFSGKISALVQFRGETTLEIPKDEIPAAATFLKSIGFNYLVDITSVDNFGSEPRFEIVYEFSSMPEPRNLRLKIKISEDDLSVPTIAGIYQTANWHEREIYDMMGIDFDNHPDLRRILMWEGYPYYPLRKDFPLEGKESNMPGEAFSELAPLEGGPFVTAPGDTRVDREPRARRPENN